jgi:hypothetical protein
MYKYFLMGLLGLGWMFFFKSCSVEQTTLDNLSFEDSMDYFIDNIILLVSLVVGTIFLIITKFGED